jgi:hypothetical protein
LITYGNPISAPLPLGILRRDLAAGHHAATTVTGIVLRAGGDAAAGPG